MTAHLLAHAHEYARHAHAGQNDLQGLDYYSNHLRPIAASLERFGHDYAIAGVLHDIIEDTDVTADDLRAEGFPEDSIEAVVMVSRIPGEFYRTLISRAASKHMSRKVKLADNARSINQNHLLARTDPAKAHSLLVGRYMPARAVLLAADLADLRN